VGTIVVDEEEKPSGFKGHQDAFLSKEGATIDFTSMFFSAAADAGRGRTNSKEPSKDRDDTKKNKSKSAGKGKDSTKKGKKKKTDKDIPSYVLDDEIPQSSKGFNLYRPDRATMQRLIRRTADLKDFGKEKDRFDLSLFYDVAPWVHKKKSYNEDLDNDAENEQNKFVNKHFKIVVEKLTRIHTAAKEDK
jgi:hypothetical protein